MSGVKDAKEGVKQGKQKKEHLTKKEKKERKVAAQHAKREAKKHPHHATGQSISPTLTYHTGAASVDHTNSDRKVFGVPLDDAVARCGKGPLNIPAPVVDTLEQLERDGMTTEGIFRVPGSMEEVDRLRMYYDGEAELGLTKNTEVYTVAGLMKLFLRELPDPLLTFRFYDTFIYVQKNKEFDKETKLRNMRNLINALPPNNRALLKYLCDFLLRIAQNADKNKMTITNLAIVFGPELLRPPNDDMYRLIQNAGCMNGIIKLILEEYEYLLGGSEPAPPVVQTNSVTDAVREVEFDRGAGRRQNHRRRNIKMEIDFSQIDWDNLDPELLKEMEEDEDGDVEENLKVYNNKQRSTEEPATPEKSPIPTDADLLANPLLKLLELLSYLRGLASRGEELSKMTSTQLIDEKRDIKHMLHGFNAAYSRVHGRLPTSNDQLPLKSLYQRYSTVKKLAKQSVARKHMLTFISTLVLEEEIKKWSTVHQSTPATSTTHEKLAESSLRLMLLQTEKRKLQLKLLQFEKAFKKKFGKPIKTEEDCDLIKYELARYAEVKNLIKQISKSGAELPQPPPITVPV